MFKVPNLFFSGNRYTVTMPTEDYKKLETELEAFSDETTSSLIKKGGSNRWFLDSDQLTIGSSHADKIQLDCRPIKGHNKSFTTVTLESNQNGDQKVHDASLFVALKNIILSSDLSEGTLFQIISLIVEEFSTEKADQTFKYKVNSMFPGVDYENILEPEMLKDPNGFHGENTFLIKAINEKNRSVIDALLAHPEINVNACDQGSYKEPPLIYAIINKDIETIKKLLLFNDLQIDLAGEQEKKTALQYAENKDPIEIYNLLKTHGATNRREFAEQTATTL